MLIKRQCLTINSVKQIEDYVSNAYSYSAIMIFDIETTGLYWKNSFAFLIGFISYENNEWFLTQYFAECQEEEIKVLKSFLCAAEKKLYFIHYNGQGFDIPYLQHKFLQCQLKNCFFDKTSIDLYRLFSPLKKVLKLEHTKQKDFELFLQVPRKDICSGRELISIYKKHSKEPSPETLDVLFLHNADDVIGLVYLLRLDAYRSLFEGHFMVVQSEILELTNKKGQAEQELLLTLSVNSILCQSFSYMQDSIYITGKGNLVKVKAPITGGMIKLYYPDFKNYYYLPLEDTAIHKSIGSYVDKEHRVQAVRSNCYQKFPCNPDFLSNQEALDLYVKNLLCFMIH